MKILFINSRYNIRPLIPLFEKLNSEHGLFLLSADSYLRKHFPSNKKNIKTIFNIENIIFYKTILFILFYPLFFFFSLVIMAYYKIIKKTDRIIFTHWSEKILFSFPCWLLRIKQTWILMPETNILKINIVLKIVLKIVSLKCCVIAFNKSSKNKIEKILSKKAIIHLFDFGIKINNHERQENIFSEISKNERIEKRKKYFTIGTAVDLNSNQNIETLFHGIKKLTMVVANIQLIIIGDGSERRNLTWLTKKMGIENITWFVGRQRFLRKWFDDFDIFVSTSKNFTLKDIGTILKAMESKLPIVGFEKTGIEDIVTKETGIILSTEDSEALADILIKLYKDKLSCRKIGERAKVCIDKTYDIDTMIDKFKKIIK